MAVKLSDLLNHAPFGMRLVTTGGTTNRIVRGVAAIDWPEPGQWLAPGYLVMTGGMGLRGSVRKQRRYIEEAHHAGAPAVGLWLDAPFKSPPRAMVGRSEELGLPMFTAPYELPSREINSFVMRSERDQRDHSFSRAMTAHDYLLGALGEVDAVDALVTRLHSVLGAAVAVFSPVGVVIAKAGAPPVEAMWHAICAEQDVAQLERDWLFTAAALVGDVPVAYLSVRVHERPHATTHAGSVARFAVRVLQMVELAGQARAEQNQASRVAVLRELLEAGDPDRALLERLGLLGFRSQTEVCVMLADTTRSATAEQTTARISAAFARRHVLNIIYVHSHSAIVLLERHVAERELLDELGSSEESVFEAVGVGRAVPLQAGIRQTHREARIALLRARQERLRIVRFDDIRLADQLLSYLPADCLSIARAPLAPLRDERPDLLQTLAAYLQRNCNVLATATALNLHPNSLRYRLSVIEKVLGRSLTELDTLLELALAMRIDAVADNGNGEWSIQATT